MPAADGYEVVLECINSKDTILDLCTRTAITAIHCNYSKVLILKKNDGIY